VVLRLCFSPRRPEQSMQVSCTPISCPLGAKVYAIYPIENAFVLDGKAKTDSTFSNPCDLPLAVHLLGQVLWIAGRFCHFVPSSEELRCSRVPWLPGLAVRISYQPAHVRDHGRHHHPQAGFDSPKVATLANV